MGSPLWGGSYFGTGAIAPPLSSPPCFGSAAIGEAVGAESHSDSGDPHLRSVAAVTGYHIHATDGEIGHVGDLLIDGADWGIRYLIVDTRNWWFGKHVLTSPYAVREISRSERQIRLNVTRSQVKASPPWDPMDMVDQAYEKRLHGYYGWPGYGF